MAEWSSGCVNFFDAFDLAILNYTSRLTHEERKSSRKAVLVKKLLTIDDGFDKPLFDFITWIISDNNREIAFSKMCEIKFIYSKSDANLLKIFVVGTSRCFVEPCHSTWVLECLTGWKKKCEKDKAPAETINGLQAMIDSTTTMFDEGQVGNRQDQNGSTKLAAPMEDRNENDSDALSPSELSADERSPRYSNHKRMSSIDSMPGAYMRPSSSHKKSQSFGSMRMSSSGLLPMGDSDSFQYQSSAKDAEIQNLRQLLSYDGPPPPSLLPYELNSVLDPVNQDFGLLLSAREQQILALQTELRRKNIENSQLMLIKKSNASFSTSDHSRLEKELRDMMKYYENALGSKEAELIALEKKFKEKKVKEDESESSAVKELQVMKQELQQEKDACAEAVAKLEDDLKKSLIKYVTLHKNSELKLERYRTELAEKNKIIASHAKYSKKSEHARYLHSVDLENSVAMIKEAQKRLEKELDDTKIGRDTALLRVASLENQLRALRSGDLSENSDPNQLAGIAELHMSGKAVTEEELRERMYALQSSDLELKKELRDSRDNLREMERRYEEMLLAQDGCSGSGSFRLSEKLKLESELKVMKNNYEQLKSATDKIVSYEESRSKYITSLENKLKVAAEEKLIIEKEFMELKGALEMFKPWEGAHIVHGLREEMKKINSYDADAMHRTLSNGDPSSTATFGIAAGQSHGSQSRDNEDGAGYESSNYDPDRRQSDVQKAKALFQKKLNITQNMIIANDQQL
mmetsp:Transcript_16879/g.23142  ORF Transcript_16879/g.23142 Transcript_16879/m.23142 type:complete len:749 (-) Transcript_16879:8-2254(-)